MWQDDPSFLEVTVQAVLILLVIASVPLSAIYAAVWLKAKKLEIQGGPSLRKDLAMLTEQTQELRERVETLETIATSATGLLPEDDSGPKKLLLSAGSGHSPGDPSLDGNEE